MDRVSSTISAFTEGCRLWTKSWIKTSGWMLVGSLCLVVLAAAGYYLAGDVRDQGGSEVALLDDLTIDEEEPMLDHEPAAPVRSPGDLILDALPWGRVVAIVDQEGEPQELGETLFTPVRLTLPAGAYRVVLENPSVERPVDFWVEVSPSEVNTMVYKFKPFDPDAYFDKAWQGSGQPSP